MVVVVRSDPSPHEMKERETVPQCITELIGRGIDDQMSSAWLMSITQPMGTGTRGEKQQRHF